MRMLVVGAGSTGGYFGGRLAEVGRDVTFLVRPGRMAALRSEGLRITSPRGNVTVRPKLVDASVIDGPYDAILLTVKAFSLEQAMTDLAPAIGPRTMILPVLNGMRHMDVLRTRFGAQAVVGCVCKIAASLDITGGVSHLTSFADLKYGEMDGTTSDRMRALDIFMQGTTFEAALSVTIERDMWEKWILLVAMGAICCLMRGSVGEIEAAPGGTRFALALFDEVVAIARAIGSAPSNAFLEVARSQLTAKGAPTTSSMFRDMLSGNRLEADQIVGDLLKRSEQAGVVAPLLNAAYAHLQVYGARQTVT